jgi:hypothetical protein
MKLVKLTAPTDDVRFAVERETYDNHCRNIATIIASVDDRNRQAAIDAYLTATNANAEA